MSEIVTAQLHLMDLTFAHQKQCVLVVYGAQASCRCCWHDVSNVMVQLHCKKKEEKGVIGETQVEQLILRTPAK